MVFCLLLLLFLVMLVLAVLARAGIDCYHLVVLIEPFVHVAVANKGTIEAIDLALGFSWSSPFVILDSLQLGI